MLFPLNGTKQIVALYWTDTNIKGSGNIFYHQTTNAGLLARATNKICTAFPTSQNVVIISLLIATCTGYVHITTYILYYRVTSDY